MKPALKELRRRSRLSQDVHGYSYATDERNYETAFLPAPPPKPPKRSEWKRKGPLVHLEPCPFCKGEAAVYNIAGSHGYYSPKVGVRCTDEHCNVKPSVAFDTEDYDWDKRKTLYVYQEALDKAVSSWNTRIN